MFYYVFEVETYMFYYVFEVERVSNNKPILFSISNNDNATFTFINEKKKKSDSAVKKEKFYHKGRWGW